MRLWHTIASGVLFLWSLGFAAYSFGVADRDGWSWSIGFNLLLQGFALATSIGTIVYAAQCEHSRRVFRKTTEEAVEAALAEVPKLVMKILADLRARGVIPDHIQFGDIGLMGASRSDKDKLN